MFTGIVETKKKVLLREGAEEAHLRIEKPRNWKLKNGQSISINGICSTVEKITPAWFSVTYMPETLRISTANDFRKGRVVNLERSLVMGERIEGHIIQGHVDGVGIVAGIRTRGESKEITIRAPLSLMRFIALKGSIAVNGTSLTVAGRTKDSFTVALIPHTLTHTTLGMLVSGSRVNIETDLIARQLAALHGK